MTTETPRYTQLVAPVPTPEEPLRAKDESTVRFVANLNAGMIGALHAESRFQGFHHGDTLPIRQKYKPNEVPEKHSGMAETLYSEITAVVEHQLEGVDPRSPEGKRVAQMAPELMKAIIGNPLIEGVQTSHIGNVVEWSIAAARNPDIIGRSAIRMGMGGSDDEDVTMRLPAYALPALELWTRLDSVRQQRIDELEKNKIRHIAQDVIRPHREDDLDVAAANGDNNRKKQIFREINEEAELRYPTYEFDDDTIAQIEAETGIFNMPKIDFFTAANAAIVINDMDTDRVLTNTHKSQRLITSFVHRFYPEATEHVSVRVDNPLKMRKDDGSFTYEGLVVSYLENLLETYDGDDVNAVMDTLRARGENHAQGEHVRAELYSALHPFFFADRLEVPNVGMTRPKDAAVANITIGGRPERLFNEIRTLLSQKAVASDFVKYADTAVQNGDITEHQYQWIERWAQALDNKRQEYPKSEITEWSRADLPAITLPLITSVGKTPVYYKTGIDVSVTAQSVADIDAAGGFDPYFEARLKDIKDRGEMDPRVKHAIDDTAILLNTPKKDSRPLGDRFTDADILEFFREFTAQEELV